MGVTACLWVRSADALMSRVMPVSEFAGTIVRHMVEGEEYVAATCSRWTYRRETRPRIYDPRAETQASQQ